MLLVGMIPGIVIGGLGYLAGVNALRDSIGENFQEIAKETADKVEIMLNKVVQDAQSLALSPYIKSAVIKANAAYDGKSEALMTGALEKALKKNGPGSGAPSGRPADSLSGYLKDYQDQRMGEYGSIIVIDGAGRVIASTDGLEGHNQATESWWDTTFVKGKVFVSAVTPDERPHAYSLSIAVPVMDGNERPQGVLRMTYDVKDIFRVITDVKIGKTGHANLVTTEGTLVVCPIFPPKSHKVNDKLIGQINTGRPGWGIAEDDAHGGKSSIIGFAPVVSTHQMGLDKIGIKRWYIFVRQLPEETYAPMYSLLWKASMLGLVLVAGLPVLGFYAARRIIMPLRLLKEGAESISRGRLDHRLDIKTNDEIEQLSEAFNRMADNLEKSNRDRQTYLSRLEESEERYRTLFEHAEDSMMMLDPEGRAIAVNEREEEVIGYPKDAILGREFAGIVAGGDRDAFTRLFKRALEGEKPPTTEIKVLSGSGGLLTMEMSVTGIRMGGRSAFAQLHLRDITKRKVLEEEIRLERDKLETIIESMGDGLDIVDMNFRIQYMNDKFLSIFGKEALGKTCYRVYAGRETPCDECPVVKGIERIGILEVNVQGRSFMITHSPLKNLDGTTSTLEIFKDITVRKSLERAIKESEERYRTLFDHAEDSMLMLDSEGRAVAVNEREEEIIGYPKDALLGRAFAAIVDEEDRDAFTGLFKRALDGGKNPASEIKILGRGRTLTMEMSITGIRIGERSAFAQVHLRDVTRRKVLEQQLLRSERLAALGRLSSTLVHDLRNPIIGINKTLEGLLCTMGSRSPEEVKRVLGDLASGSGLLIGMVNDVLDVYRNSYETLPLIISDFSVSEAIHEALKLFHAEVEERRVSVVLENRGGPVEIKGDKRRLQRVFINLLDNAIKYSPPGGGIRISFEPVPEEADRSMLFRIEDEGPGIHPADLSLVFEPFHSKDKKASKTGTGLGLYFCRVVVELHRGSIWAGNRKDGSGAVFYIKLPLGRAYEN